MNLTVSATTKDKPSGLRNGGRPENKEWTELVSVIQSQAPGEWVTYSEFIQSKEAARVGLRLRQKGSYLKGKAFSALADQVKVAMIDSVGVGKEQVVTLSIQYNPKPATIVTKPAVKAVTKKAPTKK